MAKQIRILKPGEPIPPGAVQVHLYPPGDIFKPRGDYLDKEGLGEAILERMMATWEHWVDPKYGDNPDRQALVHLIMKHADEALDAAAGKFLEQIGADDDGSYSGD